jgi:hypothetical protein
MINKMNVELSNSMKEGQFLSMLLLIYMKNGNNILFSRKVHKIIKN